LVDPVDVRRVLAERDVRDLGKVSELGAPARSEYEKPMPS
jgi:hypothetical protein